MEAFQERVVEEKRELDEKLTALCEFIKSEQFRTLSADEHGRMNVQQALMAYYSQVLGDRIEAFESGYTKI